MPQGKIINLAPVAIHKGADQQKQRALRLMEIGYHHLYDMELIAWGNDYLGAAVQDIKVMLEHVIPKGF